MAFLRKPHLWLALLLVLLAELVLRTPATALLQSGASHTGRSLQLKSALDERRERINVITLGDSIAEHGIDHRALGLALRDRGLEYASLAMPGGHLLTMRTLTRYAKEELPALRAAIVLISLIEFESIGNGSYELAIVQPWLRYGDWRWVSAHVPLERSEVSTLGSISALAGYRHQMQFLTRNPARLAKVLKWWRRPSIDERLWATGRVPENLCGMDTGSLAACLDASRPLNLALTSAATASEARASCAQLVVDGGQGDWRGHDLEAESPVFTSMRELRQQLLRELPSDAPPLVVLMPVHPLWEQERLAIGVRDWVNQIHAPLVAQGQIQLLDLSRIFEAPGMHSCEYFRDMYHLNIKGQAVITAAIQTALWEQLELK